MTQTTWLLGWLAVGLAGAGVISFHKDFLGRFHISLGFAVFWAILQALIWVLSARFSSFVSPMYDFKNVFSMGKSVLSMLVVLAVAAVAVQHAVIAVVIVVISVATAIASVILALLGYPTEYIIADTSLMAGFCAMTAPLFLGIQGSNAYLGIFPILAVLSGNSTTAVVSLVAGLGACFCESLKRFVAVIAFIAIAAIVIQKGGLFYPGDRIAVQWKIFVHVLHFPGCLIGSGLGSYLPSGFKIFHSTPLWAHPHSTFLKVLFEQGLVGVVVWGYATVIALRGLWPCRAVRGAAVGTLALFMLQDASYYALHAVFGAVLLLTGLSNSSKTVIS